MQFQPLFESPSADRPWFETDAPDRLIALHGSATPVKVAWQPLKVLDVFTRSIGDEIVAPGVKGVYIIYKNGREIYAGAGGVQANNPGGDIRKELVQHARSMRLGAERGDVFKVRVGIVRNPTIPRVKVVENLTIRRLNSHLSAGKRARLRNTRDINEFGVKKQTRIQHTGGRNIPGAMRTRPGQGRVARQTLRKKAVYEYEGEWLFEAPLSHSVL